MKIGIISQVTDLSEKKVGVDSYAYNFIQNMIKMGKSDYLYLIHDKSNGWSSDWIYKKANEIKTPKLPPILMESFGIPYTINRSKIDVLHLPEHQSNFLTAFFINKVPKILTIHDLTPLLFPQTHPSNFKFWWRWNFTLKLIKDRLKCVITDSENTKKDCIKYLGIHEEKIQVVPLAASEIYKPMSNKEEIKNELKLKYEINDPFILFVGTLEARKNISTLIKAFYKLKTRINHKLVIIGRKGWKYDEIFETIEKLNIKRDIIFTDYVPESDLVKFYNSADVFVYPSLYEGFGLPPLEAMACGCPVITSNTSSLPEVVGNAGIMVDPYDVDELAGAIYNALNNSSLRKKLSKRSLERSKLFKWCKVAKKTWNIYENIYNE